MSKRNGDKARFGKQKHKKQLLRLRSRQAAKTLENQLKSSRSTPAAVVE